MKKITTEGYLLYDDFEPVGGNTSIKTIVGDAILNGRMRNGFSQVVLASKVGVSQVYISQIETGDANPTLSILQEILDELGLTLAIEYKSGKPAY